MALLRNPLDSQKCGRKTLEGHETGVVTLSFVGSDAYDIARRKMQQRYDDEC